MFQIRHLSLSSYSCVIRIISVFSLPGVEALGEFRVLPLLAQVKSYAVYTPGERIRRHSGRPRASTERAGWQRESEGTVLRRRPGLLVALQGRVPKGLAQGRHGKEPGRLRALLRPHCDGGLPAGLLSRGWGVPGREGGSNSSTGVGAEGGWGRSSALPWRAAAELRSRLGLCADGEACVWLRASGG